MFTEEDCLPLSALQHLMYCERRAALVHLEGAWAENRFTAEGRVLHDRADSGERESRGSEVILRAVPLLSLRLGLAGRADVIELTRADPPTAGVTISGRAGRWHLTPVEYKRGKAHDVPAYHVQLCAQALCLEEMLGAVIPAGALYHGQSRKRERVTFDGPLRERTEAAAARLHTLLRRGHTPAPVADERCEHCSLIDHCLPTTRGRSARDYLQRAILRAIAESPEVGG